MLDFYKIFKYVTFRIATLCRYSSVVEHVIGNDGVASPILASGTITKTHPYGGFLLWCNLVRMDLRSKSETCLNVAKNVI